MKTWGAGRGVGKRRSWGEEFGVWGTIGIWEFGVAHIGRQRRPRRAGS